MLIRSPRDIEVKFKNSLGAITPLMCIADIASNEIRHNLSKDEITLLSRKYKHRNLNIEKIDLKQVSLYVNFAHIAYINSRAEIFCEDIVDFIKNRTKTNKEYKVDSTDLARRSVFFVHARKNDIPISTKKLSEAEYIYYFGEAELLVIDYFRRLRNCEFHGGVNSSLKIPNDHDSLITSKFGHSLRVFHEIDVRDVILYSMAWQSAAKNICSKLVSIDNELLEKIKRKYSKSSEQRLNNAMRQKLSHDYLQSAAYINILQNNGWVA